MQLSSWYDKKAATVHLEHFKMNGGALEEDFDEDEDNDDIIFGNEGRPYTAPCMYCSLIG